MYNTYDNILHIYKHTNGISQTYNPLKIHCNSNSCPTRPTALDGVENIMDGRLGRLLGTRNNRYIVM